MTITVIKTSKKLVIIRVIKRSAYAKQKKKWNRY